MGNDTVYWKGFGRIPSEGSPQADRETTYESTVRWMGVSSAGERDGGGGIN